MCLTQVKWLPRSESFTAGLGILIARFLTQVSTYRKPIYSRSLSNVRFYYSWVTSSPKRSNEHREIMASNDYLHFYYQFHFQCWFVLDQTLNIIIFNYSHFIILSKNNFLFQLTNVSCFISKNIFFTIILQTTNITSYKLRKCVNIIYIPNISPQEMLAAFLQCYCITVTDTFVWS